MALDRLLALWNAEFRAFTRFLWAEREEQSQQRLDADSRLRIQRRKAQLVRLRFAIERVRYRLSQRRLQEPRLAARVASLVARGCESEAWHLALELDHLRRGIARDRARLAFLENTYQARLRRLRARLQASFTRCTDWV